MKRLLRGLLSCLAAGLCLLELLIVGCWLRGTLYVMRCGAAENPYAAEDAEIAGICAGILFPFALAALAWLGYCIVTRKSRADARAERSR